MSIRIRKSWVIFLFSFPMLYAQGFTLKCRSTVDDCIQHMADACHWSLHYEEKFHQNMSMQRVFKDCEEAMNYMKKSVSGLFISDNKIYYKPSKEDNVWYKPEYLSVHTIKKQLKLWLSHAVFKRFGFFDVSDTLTFPSDVLPTMQQLDVPPKQIHLQAIMWIIDEHHKKHIGISPDIFTSWDIENMREQLHILESTGNVQVLAEPQLYLGVGHKAVISSGEEIPYQIADGKRTHISFKKALLTLAVKAHHIGNHGASVDVEVTFDKPSEHIYHGNVGIARQLVRTQVRLPFGKSMVMGGVYLQRQSLQKSCLPILGALPGAGFLFCEYSKLSKKSLLYVMIHAYLVQ